MDELTSEDRCALESWNKTAAKMTGDMRDRIDSLISNLEYCLKFRHGRIWLGIEARTLLASELYSVNWYDASPDLSGTKGRRAAIKHTRELNSE